MKDETSTELQSLEKEAVDTQFQSISPHLLHVLAEIITTPEQPVSEAIFETKAFPTPKEVRTQHTQPHCNYPNL